MKNQVAEKDRNTCFCNSIQRMFKEVFPAVFHWLVMPYDLNYNFLIGSLLLSPSLPISLGSR